MPISIPGANLLNTALRVIAKQSLIYYQFVSRETNAIGLDEITYATPVTIQGSFQPVEKTLYEKYGLDLSKTYFRLFVPNNVIGVDRDVSGDQVVFNGITFQCESITPWYVMDKWNEILCIKTVN